MCTIPICVLKKRRKKNIILQKRACRFSLGGFILEVHAYSFTVQLSHLMLVLMADQEKFLHNPCVPYTSLCAVLGSNISHFYHAYLSFLKIAAFMCANTVYV